jgi:subtilase family serine protease
MFFSNKSVWTFAALPLLALLPVACSGAPDGASPSSSDEALDSDAFAAVPDQPFKDVCSAATLQRGKVRCFAKVRTTVEGMIVAAAKPQGFGPNELRNAYHVPAGGKGTIAIVDAQDATAAEADLGVYRKQFGLPECTTANGCFKKVNQRGEQGNYPAPDSGWGSEIMLDIEMASAICPACKIVLVEADGADIDNLGTAVNMAVSLGADVVSNSWGGPEDDTTVPSEKYFNHPGVAIFASSGDSGFGASSPASSQFVIGVGGTSLVKSKSSRGWAERAWSGAGAGCSAFVTKPSWQTDTGCGKKTISDVSAVADPNTGVAVYDSVGSGGWAVYGGTSVSSPIVASIFAASGNGKKTGAVIWNHTKDFNDVTKGNDGTCSPAYLCTAGKGYDGPTGWGTPNAKLLGALAGSAE